MRARIASEADRGAFLDLGANHAAELAPHLRFDPQRWNARFDEYLASANPTIWLAESATGQVVGYAMASLRAHLACDAAVAYLNFLYTVPWSRNRMIGPRAAFLLMQEFEAWADRLEADESAVGVSTPYRAEATQRLYAAFGYVPTVAMQKRRRG